MPSAPQLARAPVDPPGLRAVERTVHTVRQLPTWQGIVAIVVLLVAIWGLVALAGGTRTALPHLFYLPIILAVALFALRRSLVVVLAAMMLAGPLMPGEIQPVPNWLLRGLMFLTVAVAVSASITVRDAWQSERTRRDLTLALDLRAPAHADVDRVLVDLVPAVLQDRTFSIVFQPIICLNGRGLHAVEALTRFAGPPHAPPDQWFRAAHAAGVGPELELATIELALHSSRGRLPTDVPLALNVSAAVVAHPGLRTVLERADRPIVLELTEHDVIGNYQTLNEYLADLRRLDVKIAVDDAGAGASSLRHIVQIRPDMIKLDISLTRGVHTSTVLRTLGQSVAAFAHGTDALLVVEGIENQADLDVWRELGADAAQGYLLGRPGPPEAIPVPETGR